jgi:serine/threonine-protein kinase SRK2
MGACCSSSADQYEPGKQQSAGSSSAQHHHHHKGHKQEVQKTPDFGLGEDFEVIKLLGTGGEGETWLCIDQRTKRQVAIKLVRRPIPRSITQIIQREIKILADLGDGHLNIVHADEVLLTKTHIGLVMEYVAGGWGRVQESGLAAAAASIAQAAATTGTAGDRGSASMCRGATDTAAVVVLQWIAACMCW